PRFFRNLLAKRGRWWAICLEPGLVFQRFPFFSLGIWATWASHCPPDRALPLVALEGFSLQKGKSWRKFGAGGPHSPKTLISSHSGHFFHILQVVFRKTHAV